MTRFKKVEFDNPNKMHFESLHKTFNAQTDLITSGSAQCGTQYSEIIQPGQTYQRGLDAFVQIGVAPVIVKHAYEMTAKEGGILYLFYHFNGRTQILDGLVLTSKEYRLRQTWHLNPSEKARDAVEKATKYIIDLDLHEGEPHAPTSDAAPAATSSNPS